jgi:hypothetical protein
VVAKVKERLAASKQTMHRVHMERFSLKKLNEVEEEDRLCGLVVKVPGYRYRGPGSIPGDTRLVGLEWGPLSLVMIIEELFHEILAPV